jgi:phosphoglycolate phosphatase
MRVLDLSAILLPASPPHAIIFDWDNTLVDMGGLLREIRQITCLSFANNIDQEKFQASSASAESFFATFVEPELARKFFHNEYLRRSKEELKSLPGALDTLNTLHKQNIPLLLVSNKSSSLLEDEIERLGWRDYFKTVVGSSKVMGQDKPNAHNAFVAMKSVGIEPSSNVWFIGDSDADILCAYNAGCYPLLIGDKREFTPAKYQHFADHTLLHTKDHYVLSKELSSYFVAKC